MAWTTQAQYTARVPAAIIVSDAHLGRSFRPDAFVRFLRDVPDVADHLVINGDLFDFWFEYRSGVPRGYDHVLGALRAVVDTGVPVTLMGGNHDWWGGRYLREEVGVEFLQDPVVRSYAGLRTFLAHGDGLGKELLQQPEEEAHGVAHLAVVDVASGGGR